jgi:hypothetical protein
MQIDQEEEEEDEGEDENVDEEDEEEVDEDEYDEDEEEEEETGEEKLPTVTTQENWDEQRFLNIAAKKYSKTRVVGSSTDTPFFSTDS